MKRQHARRRKIQPVSLAVAVAGRFARLAADVDAGTLDNYTASACRAALWAVATRARCRTELRRELRAGGL